MIVNCPVSLGELVDKISILLVKEKNIHDDNKLLHVKNEKNILIKTLSDLKLQGVDLFLEELKKINEELWKIEDDIREKERHQEFDDRFIELARLVYVTNDKRFKVKNEINNRFGSQIHEVKSYKDYTLKASKTK